MTLLIQFTPEIEAVAPQPVIAPAVRQMTTHRINREVDSPVTCWARTELGRMDLSSTELSVLLKPYGGHRVLAELEAIGDATGRIDFTVPARTFAGVGFGYDYGLSYDPRNLVRFDVMNGESLVYQALIEVL